MRGGAPRVLREPARPLASERASFAGVGATSPSRATDLAEWDYVDYEGLTTPGISSSNALLGPVARRLPPPGVDTPERSARARIAVNRRDDGVEGRRRGSSRTDHRLRVRGAALDRVGARGRGGRLALSAGASPRWATIGHGRAPPKGVRDAARSRRR